MDKLISIAVALVLIAASTGNLPRVIQAVHVAQLQLIKDSRASAWGRPFLLPTSK